MFDAFAPKKQILSYTKSDKYTIFVAEKNALIIF